MCIILINIIYMYFFQLDTIVPADCEDVTKEFHGSAHTDVDFG